MLIVVIIRVVWGQHEHLTWSATMQPHTQQNFSIIWHVSIKRWSRRRTLYQGHGSSTHFFSDLGYRSRSAGTLHRCIREPRPTKFLGIPSLGYFWKVLTFADQGQSPEQPFRIPPFSDGDINRQEYAGVISYYQQLVRYKLCFVSSAPLVSR